VHALSLLNSRRGTEALAELREVVAASPDWETATLALGSTLIRRGLFAEARSEYERIVGPSTAVAIEDGDETRVDLTRNQLEALFGLAICRDEEGDVRRADRLYRAYADRMGVASADAARAFYRLAVMLERTDMPWGDANAERDRALALDPSIETSDMLPQLPDPEADPRTEPYTRLITLVGTEPSHAPNEATPDDSTTVETVPPALISYVRPWPETADSDSLPGTEVLDVELLVGPSGTVEDVRIDDCDSIWCGALVDLAFATARWSFAPATVNGEPVAARIVFPVPQNGAPEAPDVDGGEAPAAPNADEGEGPAAPNADEGEGP